MMGCGEKKCEKSNSSLRQNREGGSSANRTEKQEEIGAHEQNRDVDPKQAKSVISNLVLCLFDFIFGSWKKMDKKGNVSMSTSHFLRVELSKQVKARREMQKGEMIQEGNNADWIVHTGK